MPTVIEFTEAPDPARCCEAFAGLPYRLFLDSATPGTRLGRYSFVTADPVAVVQSKGARTEIRSRNGVRTVEGDVLFAVVTKSRSPSPLMSMTSLYVKLIGGLFDLSVLSCPASGAGQLVASVSNPQVVGAEQKPL